MMKEFFTAIETLKLVILKENEALKTFKMTVIHENLDAKLSAFSAFEKLKRKFFSESTLAGNLDPSFKEQVNRDLTSLKEAMAENERLLQAVIEANKKFMDTIQNAIKLQKTKTIAYAPNGRLNPYIPFHTTQLVSMTLDQIL